MTNLDRTGFIGGSDAAAILNISPWKTPLALYLEKTAGADESMNEKRTKVLERGKRMEPYIIDLFQEETGLTVTRRNEHYIDTTHNFLQAQIDAETSDGENIEIKTCNPFNAKLWGEEQTDEVPLYYLAQAMHGLMVTGRDTCHFGVLIGSDDFRTYRVQRDEELIKLMRDKEIEFWNKVQTKTPPDAVNEEDIRKLYSIVNTDNAIECTPDVLAKVNNLRELNEELKEKTKEKERLETEIKLYMRDNTVLTLEGTPIVTWKMITTSRFNSNLFKQEQKELYEAYKRTTQYRVFKTKA